MASTKRKATAAIQPIEILSNQNQNQNQHPQSSSSLLSQPTTPLLMELPTLPASHAKDRGTNYHNRDANVERDLSTTGSMASTGLLSFHAALRRASMSQGSRRGSGSGCGATPKSPLASSSSNSAVGGRSNSNPDAINSCNTNLGTRGNSLAQKPASGPQGPGNVYVNAVNVRPPTWRF